MKNVLICFGMVIINAYIASGFADLGMPFASVVFSFIAFVLLFVGINEAWEAAERKFYDK